MSARCFASRIGGLPIQVPAYTAWAPSECPTNRRRADFSGELCRRRLDNACANVPPARTTAATNAVSAISCLVAPASRAWRVWVSVQ